MAFINYFNISIIPRGHIHEDLTVGWIGGSSITGFRVLEKAHTSMSTWLRRPTTTSAYTANRMLPHPPRRHVTGVDRRNSVSEQHRNCRLRPFQMKGDLITAILGWSLGWDDCIPIKAAVLLGRATPSFPGDRDVISQVLRDSSSGTKIAPNAVRIAACAGQGASSGIVASRVGGTATSLSMSNGR
jgi:hypothetical protein